MGSISQKSVPSIGTNPKTFEMPQVEIDYDFDSPRFSVNQSDEILEGVKYLDEHGYAVFGDVLSKEEISNSIELFWNFLETTGGRTSIRRNQPDTWNDWPETTYIGLVNDRGVGQSQFMWSIRGSPNIKKVFSKIWNSDELLVSFDSAGCFRDWHIDPRWKTRGSWFHCDQNPIAKPTRCSIQGLVSLIDADESTGGLLVVPGSHEHFADLKSYQKSNHDKSGYVRVPENYPLLQKLKPRLIKCKAGDLIVWDSRCIHCNTPGLEKAERKVVPPEVDGLLRIVAYVCMSPMSMFVPKPGNYETVEELRAKRNLFIQRRIACTHWPFEMLPSDRGEVALLPLKLNEYQKSLIDGTNVEYTVGGEETVF